MRSALHTHAPVLPTPKVCDDRPYGAKAISLVAMGCGSPSEDSSSTSDANPQAPSYGGPRSDAGPAPSDDELETLTGCPGVFNPGQLLDYGLVMNNADRQTVVADTSSSVYLPATLQCGTNSLEVGVRRKRSGEIAKPSLKIDINQFVAGQEYFGLRKLSLESGIGEGGTMGSVESVLSEYLAWRLVNLSETMGSRSSLVRLTVNGEFIGVYVNVEQPDKRFLQSRLFLLFPKERMRNAIGPRAAYRSADENGH